MRLVGVVLLLLLPVLVADGVISARGGFMGAFWASARDSKVEHIAGHRRQWAATGLVWVAMLAVAIAGVGAFGALLGQAGEWILASIALGLFVPGVVSMLATVFFLYAHSGWLPRFARVAGRRWVGWTRCGQQRTGPR